MITLAVSAYRFSLLANKNKKPLGSLENIVKAEDNVKLAFIGEAHPIFAHEVTKRKTASLGEKPAQEQKKCKEIFNTSPLQVACQPSPQKEM